ncbi:ATP-binding cassette domain-containing protein [Saccharopolyspora sp. K220]|uniref:ABC transporter ATP-binding protein n=1 Tax=Saccharopolyspora soli TaxID=2926618 RepID=UPI001F5979BE|nr:ABC transporter ATP-binding protein [Saccharopolyspora soli]MCI2417089.1 ATP-binding cassette domain-containing protein [Saccharopolyspora soli]
MGVEVVVDGLSKSFGAQTIWRDVTLTLPPGEISVLLGPSGTGKSVFLKSLVGLLKPDQGEVVINGVDICTCSEQKLYEIRKLFGVLFQDGALFGSMNLFDNIAFPLREHTRKSESEIRSVVLEKMEMVGLIGAEEKLPGEISGGMRKRAGLARALVLDPEIILFDEPDSGLDPVRTALLNQLIVDLNAQIDATFLIVTHDINTARTVPDNIGMLFSRNLVTFGPREVLLTSTEPVVEQFLNGRPQGPIGMSEEKDAGQAAAELAQLRDADLGVPHIMPQLEVTAGLPERAAVRRRKDRVLRQLRTLAPAAQQEIMKTLTPDELALYGLAAPATGSWPQRTEPVRAANLPQPVRPSPRPRQPERTPEQPPWSGGAEQEAGEPRRRWFGRKRGER